MADSPIRQEALRLVAEAQTMDLMGAWQRKAAPAVAAAILDLADAVRELARKA